MPSLPCPLPCPLSWPFRFDIIVKARKNISNTRGLRIFRWILLIGVAIIAPICAIFQILGLYGVDSKYLSPLAQGLAGLINLVCVFSTSFLLITVSRWIKRIDPSLKVTAAFGDLIARKYLKAPQCRFLAS